MAKTNKKTKVIEKQKKSKKKAVILFTITFFTTLLLGISTYAWFSASLNVKVKFFDMKVSTDTGLFISLDGVEFSDTVEITYDSIITDLRNTYPGHTNQWANNGLWSVSSNGIPNPNSDKFAVYSGDINKYRDKERRGQLYLNTRIIPENETNEWNKFVSFDIFLKNVSGSPYNDNLYLTKDTFIEIDEGVDEEVRTNMQGIMNSLRLGIVRIGDTTNKAPVNVIQNLQCNNNCKMVIYEPNSRTHSPKSIEVAKEYGFDLVDGVYVPTYGIVKEGNYLNHKSGYMGLGAEFDPEHFRLQETIEYNDLETPIFQIPNGITKFRVYVWVEGQDIDSLETHSDGAPLAIGLDFIKDLAGYEPYNN